MRYPSFRSAAFAALIVSGSLLADPLLTGRVYAATAAPAATAAQAGTAAAVVIAPRPGAQAPDFTLPDAAGKTHSLSEYRGKWVVLEWVNYDCPFVRKHYGSGNMQALQKASRAKGAVWLSISSSAPGKEGHFEGRELAQKMADMKAQPDAYLQDPEGKVGRAFQAKTTPTMFVINPEGKVIYAGAIDDKPSTDKEDVATAKNYVQAALDAGLAGKPVEVASTKSYGCGVKYKN